MSGQPASTRMKLHGETQDLPGGMSRTWCAGCFRWVAPGSWPGHEEKHKPTADSRMEEHHGIKDRNREGYRKADKLTADRQRRDAEAAALFRREVSDAIARWRSGEWDDGQALGAVEMALAERSES